MNVLSMTRTVACLLAAVAVFGNVALAAQRVEGQRPAQTRAFTGQMRQDAGFMADMAKAAQRGLTVVAPAGGMVTGDRQKMLSLAASLQLAFPAEALAPGVIPYNANTDEVRLRLLTWALTDPDSRIVWSLRGGYGSGRLLPGLSRLQPPARPKIFVGYSDMTFMHLFLQRWGWQTVHAGMFFELDLPDKDPENFRRLAALLSGRIGELRYEGIQPFNAQARALAQPLSGPLTGGNLACLASAAGTPWALNASGSILFLEDIQEPGYKLDRLFIQLKDSGALQGVRAILLGSFVQCKDDADFALLRFAAECGVPVFKADTFGHGTKNYPLVFNAPAQLAPDGTGAFRLTINTEALQK